MFDTTKILCHNHNINGKDICELNLLQNITIDKNPIDTEPLIIYDFAEQKILDIKTNLILYSIFFLLFTIYMQFYRRENNRYIYNTYRVLCITFPLVVTYCLEVLVNFYILDMDKHNDIVSISLIISSIMFAVIGSVVYFNINKIE